MPNYDVFLQYAVPDLVELAFLRNGGSNGPRGEIDITDQIREIRDLTTIYNPFQREYRLPSSVMPYYLSVGNSNYVPSGIIRANFQNSP